MSLPEPTIEQAAAFLREHGAGPKVWPEEAVMPWLEWHWNNGGVGIAYDENGIYAVGVARCLAHLSDSDMRYMHTEDGFVLWCDELASTRKEGISILLALARDRFGPRLAVVGQVFKRPGKLRMLPWKIVERLITQLTPSDHGLSFRSRRA
jgi:hypothetical protein